MEKGAILSQDKKYRYLLWRIWGEGKILLYIGLNPSTANANEDDPTIRRLIVFSRDHGYSGFYIGNLFPYISSDSSVIYKKSPHELWGLEANNKQLDDIEPKIDKVVLMWGNQGLHTWGRDKDISKRFPDALCFGKTNHGAPKHPLYLSSNTKLRPFN